MPVILITGTSSGIGLATALYFARKGYEVYAGLRNPDGALDLNRALEEEGLKATLIEIDVDHDDSVHRGVDKVLAKAGRIDVLVNNAGVGGGWPIEEVPVDVAKQIFETNYFGAIRMINAVLPGMRQRQSGTIVNISSVAGRIAMAALGHYSASKHALEAASEILAQEVRAYNIRVAIVEPGVVLTPILEKNMRALDPASPYVDQVRRLYRYFEKQLQNPTLPGAVAEMVAHAVTTGNPRLRYLVGDDARIAINGRKGITDEDWVEDGRKMTDEQYFEAMYKRYGTDLFLWQSSDKASQASHHSGNG
jgi:NAD(P)-dependent dehydrogenase (short-subunit alcohol dehydrogenase family)